MILLNKFENISKFILILYAYGELLKTDAYYLPYLLIFGCFCMLFHISINNGNKLTNSRDRLLTYLFSLVLTGMIVLSNYPIWTVGGIREIFVLTGLSIGVFCSVETILEAIVFYIYSTNKPQEEEISKKDTQFPKKCFWISFLLIVFIDTIVLFLCKYPGNLTADSINQINMIKNGVYTNHHPFAHTMVIKACITFGEVIFNDINQAVCVYAVFQILFMAYSFSFSAKTVAEATNSKAVPIIILIFNAIMPYNIAYSITMWKDVMFGGFTLLLVVFLYRCLAGIGSNRLNLMGLFISGLGVCLFRSNGLFAYLGTTIIFAILFGRQKDKHKILIIMGITIVCTLFFNKVCLNAISVEPGDTVEKLSIPLQQVAKDIIDNDDWNSEQLELIEKVVDLDAVKRDYLPYISDPVKAIVRQSGNKQYFDENPRAFISLYLNRLVKHPATYVQAWVEQTKGYWNSGYGYWRWLDMVDANMHGIERTVKSEQLNGWVERYFDIYTKSKILQLFVSIGLFTWINMATLFAALIMRDKIKLLLSIPTLMVVISLVIATPVFSEFRYDYAMFCAMPVVVALTVTGVRTKIYG